MCAPWAVTLCCASVLAMCIMLYLGAEFMLYKVPLFDPFLWIFNYSITQMNLSMFAMLLLFLLAVGTDALLRWEYTQPLNPAKEGAIHC